MKDDIWYDLMDIYIFVQIKSYVKGYKIYIKNKCCDS